MIKLHSEFTKDQVEDPLDQMTDLHGWSFMWLYSPLVERVPTIGEADALDIISASQYKPIGAPTQKHIIHFFPEYPSIGALQTPVKLVHQLVTRFEILPENIFFMLCDTNDAVHRGSMYKSACSAWGTPVYDINEYYESAYESYVITKMPNYVEPNVKRCELNNYLSLNAKMDKFHRIGSMWMLDKFGIYDRGIISMHAPPELDYNYFFRHTKSTFTRYGIPFEDVVRLMDNRKDCDVKKEDQLYHYEAFPTDPNLYKETFMSFISETNAEPFATEFFATEKTFRAILNCHPFVTVSTQHFLKNLRSFGYKTFSSYIDESYDDEPDVYRRIEKATLSLKQAINAPRKVKEKMYEIAMFNQNHLLNRVKNDYDKVTKLLSA